MVDEGAKLYIYYTLFAILGGFIVINAILTTNSNGFSYPLTLVFVGGSGMVLTAAYKILTADPSSFATEGDTPARDIIVLGSGALLALFGLVLQLIN